MTTDRSLVREWACANGLRATFTHYPAAGRHDRHAHDHLQISFVLAGWLRETIEGREHFACGVSRGHKPAGTRHSDLWGDDGVLIFSLRLDETLAADSADGGCEPGWSQLSDAADVGALVRLFATGSSAELREEAAMDLIASAVCVEPRPGPPPPWLERARQAIQDAPQMLCIQQAANEAGVHRAYLCRLFRCFYGVAPSIYRRRVLLGGQQRPSDGRRRRSRRWPRPRGFAINRILREVRAPTSG